MCESWDMGDKPLVVPCSYTSPLCRDVITTKDYKDVVHHAALLSSLLVPGLRRLSLIHFLPRLMEVETRP